MLIQFPFLIAYYALLGIALDLRHAHGCGSAIFRRAIPLFHSADSDGGKQFLCNG